MGSRRNREHELVADSYTLEDVVPRAAEQRVAVCISADQRVVARPAVEQPAVPALALPLPRITVRQLRASPRPVQAVFSGLERW